MTLLWIFIVLLTFVFMEFVAWFSHKYIMHGFLWSLHKDHHIKDPSTLPQMMEHVTGVSMQKVTQSPSHAKILARRRDYQAQTSELSK